MCCCAVCRNGDGYHYVVGQSKQLCKSVDLPVVQRPRDAVVAVPAPSEATLPCFKRFQHGRLGDDEGQPSWQSRTSDRRHGTSPSGATGTVNNGQRQKTLLLCRFVMLFFQNLHTVFVLFTFCNATVLLFLIQIS